MDTDAEAASRLRDTAELPPPLPEPASAVLPVPLPAPAPYLGYSSPAKEVYESPRRLARLLIPWIWIVAALQVMMVWPGMDDIFELRDERAQRAAGTFIPPSPLGLQMSASDWVFLVVGAAQGVAWIVMIVFWAMWVYRTYRNLTPLGAEGISTTPAWAVAYNFIPIVHMIWPFLVMLETFRASDPRHQRGTDWQLLPASRLVLAWWGLYLLTFVVALATGFIMTFSDNVETKYVAAWAGLFGLLTGLVVTVMEVRIVQRVTNLQEERAGTLAGAPLASPARAVS